MTTLNTDIINRNNDAEKINVSYAPLINSIDKEDQSKYMFSAIFDLLSLLILVLIYVVLALTCIALVFKLYKLYTDLTHNSDEITRIKAKNELAMLMGWMVFLAIALGLGLGITSLVLPLVLGSILSGSLIMFLGSMAAPQACGFIFFLFGLCILITTIMIMANFGVLSLAGTGLGILLGAGLLGCITTAALSSKAPELKSNSSDDQDLTNRCNVMFR